MKKKEEKRIFNPAEWHRAVERHKPIFEKMGFSCDNWEQHKEDGCLLVYLVEHEYTIPECVGIVRSVMFTALDFWSIADGGTRKRTPFIDIRADLHSFKQIPNSVRKENEKLALDIVSHRYPTCNRSALLEKDRLSFSMNEIRLYNYSLDEMVTDDDLEFELDSMFRIADAKMKTLFGFERTTERM